MYGVVFFLMGWGVGFGVCVSNGVGVFGTWDSLWRIKFLLGDYALNL